MEETPKGTSYCGFHALHLHNSSRQNNRNENTFTLSKATQCTLVVSEHMGWVCIACTLHLDICLEKLSNLKQTP